MTEQDIGEIARHTSEMMEDRDMTKGEAASRMAEQLEGVTAADIIKEM